MSSLFPGKEIPLLSATKWRKLSLRWRIAVGASLVDEVAAMYSPYFRKRFRIENTLCAAWGYAESGKLPAGTLNRLEAYFASIVDDCGDCEGYCFHESFMAGYLLGEIANPNGRSISLAVCGAAIGLSQIRLYQCNLRSTLVDPEVGDSLGEPVFWASQERYDQALHRPEGEIKRSVFRDMPIRLPELPIEVHAAMTAQAKRRTKNPDFYLPPIHERPGPQDAPRPSKATRLAR
jgi:hypothetical protein